MKRAHVPIRTCIGCRRKRPAWEMIRFKVLGDMVVVAERKRDYPGRGCYACRREECLEAALKKGSLSRALRRNIAGHPLKGELLRELEQKG
jgi:uncharacterized protein